MELNSNIILQQTPSSFGQRFQEGRRAKLEEDEYARNVLRQQQQDARLGRQDARLQRDDDDEQALKGIFQGSIEQGENGSPRLNEQKLLQSLYSRNPEMAMKLQQQFQERDINNGKLKRDNETGNIELMTKKAKYGRDVMAGSSPQDYAQRRQHLIEQGFAFAEGLPEKFDADVIGKTVMDADSYIKQNAPKEYGTGVNYDENGRGFVMDKLGTPKFIGTNKAPDKVNLPSGYEANPAGGIQPMKGYKDQYSDNTYSNKPLPTTALKMQNEGLDKLSIASNNNAKLTDIETQINEGKLDLGLISNLTGKALNSAGMSTESSRNLSSFKSSLEKLRNDSLRLNTGVQTDGDAQRAWNELFENINDKELVLQRLAEIKQINARGVDLQKLQVENIRSNYNAAPIDYSRYEAPQKPANPQGNILAKQAKITDKPSFKKMTSTDSQAITWAKKNPSDPRAKTILQLHGIK